MQLELFPNEGSRNNASEAQPCQAGVQQWAYARDASGTAKSLVQRNQRCDPRFQRLRQRFLRRKHVSQVLKT